MATVYEVMTNMDPETLTEVAVETYRQWLSFALGQSEIGGKALKHPSGRYAASLSWRQTGEASVSIIADESIAPEGKWIEEGASGADMKAAMLMGGKIGADGYRYRDIPIRSNPAKPNFDINDAIQTSHGGRMPEKATRLWAKAREVRDPNSHIVRMTDKPGSSSWIVPPMPAYSPASILADMLRRVATLVRD